MSRVRAGLQILRGVRLGALGCILLVAAGGCGSKPEVVVRPTSSPAAAAAVAGATGGSGAAAAPSETPIPGGVVTSVKDLIDRYGWPPGTDYARMRIPTIGVDARVGSRVVERDAVMPDPAGPADIVWYDMSKWPGFGGAPGGGGNAIFSGHVDYAYNIPYAQVAYRGQGVFSQLSLLSQGDIVEMEYRGQTLRYRVVSRQQLQAGADWLAIWSGKVAKDTITLYTCGGAFDAKTLEYADRIVVRAERL
ncbi:MAG: class F sortase [Dehalococcoidia bacterium]|nr:class F sortase [Dehalococcoidia bacterium]